MLKELTKSDLLGMLSIPAGRVPEALILWGTRNLKARYAAMRPFFANVLEVGSPNGIIEDVLIGDIAGSTIAYASVYGAPMASEITHIFGVLGTRRVVQIGTCGGLADDLAAGDLFVAESAYCGEGAAQYYKTDGKEVRATLGFDGLPLGGRSAAPVRKGRIYTTSALFAEGQADVERWAAEGFAAVDMETATTFAVAEHFGMQRGSLLVCFDNPRRREHILIADDEKTQRRNAAQKRMVEIALDSGRQHMVKCSEQAGGDAEITSQFICRDVGADGIDAVRGLWEKLTLHHARMSPRFGDQVRLRTFEARKQKLLAKASAGRLRVELAVSRTDGASVAYCICTVSADGVGEIDSLFVEEHLRGQGIGTELMRHALAWLDSMSVTAKIVSVMHENADAIAFYGRFAFHPRTILLQESHDGTA